MLRADLAEHTFARIEVQRRLHERRLPRREVRRLQLQIANDAAEGAGGVRAETLHAVRLVRDQETLIVDAEHAGARVCARAVLR